MKNSTIALLALAAGALLFTSKRTTKQAVDAVLESKDPQEATTVAMQEAVKLSQQNVTPYGNGTKSDLTPSAGVDVINAMLSKLPDAPAEEPPIAVTPYDTGAQIQGQFSWSYFGQVHDDALREYESLQSRAYLRNEKHKVIQNWYQQYSRAARAVQTSIFNHAADDNAAKRITQEEENFIRSQAISEYERINDELYALYTDPVNR